MDRHLVSSADASTAAVVIKFDNNKAAQSAVEQFHGQNADGYTLAVVLEASTLAPRMGVQGRSTPVVADLLPNSSDSVGGCVILVYFYEEQCLLALQNAIGCTA